MWRKNIVLFLICLFSLEVQSQTVEEMDCILRFLGCDSPEELDEYEVERLNSYLERPIRINLVSVSSLRSCGLFSGYQAASLTDYMSRHGDVMSYAELASVDGFSEEAVRRLSPFISLDGGEIAGRSRDDEQYVSDLAVRGGSNFSDTGPSGGYGLKYRGRLGDRMTLSMSASRTYADVLMAPDLLSGNFEWKPYGRKYRLIAGDFNARFGQGLALWNGMSMTGLSKMSSFIRTTSGISASWSYTGNAAYTGIAGEYSISRLRISSFLAFPGIKDGGCSLLPAINIAWYGRRYCASLTHYLEMSPGSVSMPGCIPDMKTSADVSMCLNGTDVSAEVTADWVSRACAALACVRFPIGEDICMASHIRYYPADFNPSRSAAPRSVSRCSNEHGFSLCCEYSPGNGLYAGSVSVDAAYLPVSKVKENKSLHIKVLAEGEIRLNDSMMLRVRLSERARTWGHRFRTDVRTDLQWESSGFSAAGRLNIVKCEGYGFLGYVEGGYGTGNLAMYLRQLFFFADDWDDRIYAYERDAPGSFTVPAFYGRGMNTVLTLSWRFSRWGRLYAKGTFTSYPFMDEQKKKPGKAGLKLQFVLSF